jgi:hypothetical protein
MLARRMTTGAVPPLLEAERLARTTPGHVTSHITAARAD